MNYYNKKVCPSGHILSIDNVRIAFSLNACNSNVFSAFFSDISRLDIYSYPTCTRDFSFKYLWTITYGVDSSMTVGFEFNGSNHASDVLMGYLDFNPNKVANFDRFWLDYRQIKSMCDSWIVKRVDVALDVHSKRENIFLRKDSRVYELKAYSMANKTEYLGKRNNLGRVKVYNKTLESKLDYDLTRIEVTCEPTVDSFLSHFPVVHDISCCGQFDFALCSLNDTDQAILRYAISALDSGSDAGLMIFNSLSRWKKEKLEPFLLPESSLVICDVMSLKALFYDFKGLFMA